MCDNKFCISFQTSAYDYLSFAQEISFAIEHNVPAFEIFFDGWMPNDITETERNLLKQAAANGMKFSVHSPLRNYLTEQDIKDIMPVIKFCREWEACLMTVHFDRLSPEMIPVLHSALGEVKLSIENTIPDENAVTGQKYPEFITEMSRLYPIYATADIGHAVVNGYEPTTFLTTLLQNGVNIDCFHIHNNDGLHDQHRDITDGVIDYDKLLTFIFEHQIFAHFVTEHWGGNVKSADFFTQILQKWENRKF